MEILNRAIVITIMIALLNIHIARMNIQILLVMVMMLVLLSSQCIAEIEYAITEKPGGAAARIVMHLLAEYMWMLRTTKEILLQVLLFIWMMGLRGALPALERLILFPGMEIRM